MQEVKFISAKAISTEYTRNVVKDILELMCQNEEYGCNYSMMDAPVGPFRGLYNDFSVHENDTGNRVLWGKVECSPFLEAWGLSPKENPKRHLGKEVYNIMLIRETGELLKTGENSFYNGVLFAFDFFIRILDKMPELILETQAYDRNTMFKEFNKKQLIKLQNEFAKTADIDLINNNFY